MFHEFEVFISMTTSTQGQAWVNSSEFGKTPYQFFALPVISPHPMIHAAEFRRDIAPEQVWDAPAPDLGAQLGEALFQGEIGLWYQKAISHKKPLRFRLDLSARDLSVLEILHNLPWEMLKDLQGRQVFLQCGHSLVRKTSLPAAQSPTVRGRMRVLLLSSSPSNLAKLNLNLELENTLRLLKKAGAKVTLLPKPGEATIERSDFFDALDKGQHVLHFLGHSGLNELCFTDKNGQALSVSAQDIETDLQNLPEKKRPRVAFFNSCSSGAHGRLENSVSGLAETVHKAGIPVVVAMRQTVADTAAIAFSAGFYEKLARGADIDSAVSFGRLRIHQLVDAKEEWHIPMLYASLKNTRLFQPLFPPKVKAFATGFGVGLLALLIWWFLHPTHPTLVLPPIQVAADISEQDALWQEDLGMKAVLAQAGFQILEDPSATPAEYRLEQELSIEAPGIRLQGLLTSDTGKMTPKAIVLHGPANPSADQIALLKLGMVSKLMQALGKKAAQQSGAQEAMAAYLEGLAVFDQNKVQAIAAFEKALALDPNHLPARNNLAMAQLRVGQKEAAEKTMDPLLNKPQFPQVALNAALILKANQKFDAAETHLQKTILRDPGFLPAYLELGKLKLQQNLHGDALQAFEKAASMSPKDPTVQKYLGRTYLELGAFQDAQTALEAALDLYQAENLADTPSQLAETRFFLAKLHHLQDQDTLAKFHLRHLDLAHLWEFRQDAKDLSETLRYRLDAAPVAQAVSVSGYALIQNRGKRLQAGTSLRHDDQLAISDRVRVELVCEHGFKISLKGPATWDATTHLASHTEVIPPWLFSTLLAQDATIAPAGMPLKMIPTRNYEQLHLMAPRIATPYPRPTLIWLVETLAPPYLLTLQSVHAGTHFHEVPSSELERRTISLGGQSFHLLQTPWPASWPDLVPDQPYQVRVRDVQMQQGTASLSLLAWEKAEALQSRLAEVATLGMDQQPGLVSEVLLEFDCGGAALTALIETANEADTFTVANGLLRSGLSDLAAQCFAFEVSRTEDLDRKIYCLTTLGQIQMQQQRYGEARTSFLNARGLMPHPMALRDQVDQWLAELPNDPSPQPVKKDARLVLPF